MRRYFIFFFILLFACAPITWAQEEQTDLTELGQKVPEFSVTTLDGQKFSSHDLKTKATGKNDRRYSKANQ